MPVSRKRSGGPIASAFRKALRGRRGTRWGSRVQYGKNPGRKTRFFKAVKSAMMKASDVKAKYQAYYFQGGATATRVFTHDSLHQLQLAATNTDTSIPTALTAGGLDNQRIGSDVYSIGFRVRGSFGIPFNKRNTIIKIWKVEYNSNQGTPTDVTNWYRNVTGNNALDPVNTERFPGVKLLKTLRVPARDLNATDATSIHQLYYNLWIPWKRHLKYATGGAANPSAGCKEHMSLIMTCYDTFSTLATDNLIVDHDQAVTWYYKDL